MSRKYHKTLKKIVKIELGMFQKIRTIELLFVKNYRKHLKSCEK